MAINKKNTTLIKSVCKVSCILLSEVESMVTGSTRFHRTITLKTGKNYTDIYFTPGSAEFTEKPKDTDSGILYEQSLKIQFPGEDETNLVDLDALTGPPLLIKMELSSGLSKLIGELENGAKMEQTEQLGQKSTGYVLEFLCRSHIKACWATA